MIAILKCVYIGVYIHHCFAFSFEISRRALSENVECMKIWYVDKVVESYENTTWFFEVSANKVGKGRDGVCEVWRGKWKKICCEAIGIKIAWTQPSLRLYWERHFQDLLNYIIVMLQFIVLNMNLANTVSFYWFRVPQDVVATGGKCFVMKWVTG